MCEDWETGQVTHCFAFASSFGHFNLLVALVGLRVLVVARGSVTIMAVLPFLGV